MQKVDAFLLAKRQLAGGKRDERYGKLSVEDRFRARAVEASEVGSSK